MSRNQVSITISRFGDQSPNGKRQIIRISADANNTYEALCAAFYEALDAVQAYENPLPSFGRRSSSDDLPESTQCKPTWDGRDFHLREYTAGVKVKITKKDDTSEVQQNE